MKDTAFCHNRSICIAGSLIDFRIPITMGILNFTEDSFFRGSRLSTVDAVMKAAEIMVDEGADILDIGACSTRPGAELVPAEKELKKVVAAIQKVSKNFPKVFISVDTFRAEVARAAIEAGAHMINDIGGGDLDDRMFETVAELGVPYVLMHNRGTPKNMNARAGYEDVVDEVIFELSQKMNVLRKKGVADVIADPGIGFAKRVSHNFEILRRLTEFSILDAPLLIGLSRKSLVWRTLDSEATEALNGTTALHMIALEGGANILRVHDVREAREAIRLHTALHGLTE